jgi:hypothetical protein
MTGYLPLEPVASPDVHTLDEFMRGQEDYFFSSAWERTWRPALRTLILKRFREQLAEHSYAIVKEPHGSQAAELLMSLLPSSRLIFLLRDPRDVIDSMLDTLAPHSWFMAELEGFRALDREAVIRSQAYAWLWRTEAVQRAFDAHRDDLKMLVRYEDIRADPKPTLVRLADWLDLNEKPIVKLAELTAIDRMPSEEIRPGRFIRSAAPGRWRTSLSRQEQDLIHDILAEKLTELGYSAD